MADHPAIAGAPRVFISYRREETAGHAGRVYDAATVRFGVANVFMDVDLKPGIDFVDRITRAVEACHVLLVMSGPRWVETVEGGVPARLADPEDFVRLEVRTGLRRQGVTVIPVLVAGAGMPDADSLPEDLHALTRRNAIELSDQRWRYDLGRLMTTIEELLAGPAAAAPAPGRGTWRRRGAQVATPLGALALAGVAAAGVLALRGSGDGDENNTSAKTGRPKPIAVARPGETAPPVRVTVSEPGQRSTFTFTGTEGERVAPDVRDVGVPASIWIYDPADEAVMDDYGFEEPTLLRTERCETPGGCQPVTLKRTGRHRVVVEGDGDNTGSLALRLYEVDPNLQRSAEIGGPPVTIALEVGQSASLAFEIDRPNQPVELRLMDIELSLGNVEIRDPQGRVLVEDESFSADEGERTFSQTPTRSGTYTAYFRGNDLASGSFKVELTDR